ncbi:MAG: type II toxin-antitoxin system Phd/YefM family antitoxin [Aquificota bacterium]|nr:MAG: type II toxin-antitoxin system Phd/YefM family antitoxin [Aquificota bacterium]RLD98567.1 MAG: type II toxin-antitoxin system Phd/YefM family antitoxin [Aquificota bacterium]
MAVKANIHEAKSNLSKLIELMLEGEEVIIAKAGKPIARLVPIREREDERELGFYEGKIELLDDVDQPLPDDVAEEFYK